MNVNRAREIFGTDIDHLSDHEVELFIARTTQVVDSFLDIFKKSLTEQRKEGDNPNGYDETLLHIRPSVQRKTG